MKIYFIAGLGADKRAFHFLDLSFCEAHFINWLTPLAHEDLPAYASRLFGCINDETATVVGLSFGGMLATEMAKQHPRLKVIIISSSKTYREIPGYLRFWRHVPLYNYVSNKNIKYTGGFVLRILGAKGLEQRKLQFEILQTTDTAFTKWAMGAIVNWRNTIIPGNVVHIHGTADKLLPYKYVQANYAIAGGEHIMVMDKANEIVELLKQITLSSAQVMPAKPL